MEGYSLPKPRSQNDTNGAREDSKLSSPSKTIQGRDNNHPSSPVMMRHVSIQLPEGHSPSAHRRAHYVATATSRPASQPHKIPDLLDDAASHEEEDEDAPSLTSCSIGSGSMYSGMMSVESLRRDQSGQLMDRAFDDLSDDDDDYAAEIESRRRAPHWQSNSLLAAAAVARSASSSTNNTGKDHSDAGRMLLRSDTMEVVEESFGAKAITSECHLPDEAAFARQYLSTLFCGMGEVMGCAGAGH